MLNRYINLFSLKQKWNGVKMTKPKQHPCFGCRYGVAGSSQKVLCLQKQEHVDTKCELYIKLKAKK